MGRWVDNHIGLPTYYCYSIIVMKKLFALLVIFGLFFVGCSSGLDPETKYKVTYYGNGQTSGYVPTDSQKYKYGEEAVVKGKNTLVKTRFEFAGWNTKSNGLGNSYNEDDIITIKGAVFLYAIWDAIREEE
jgi:hypothetical protein